MLPRAVGRVVRIYDAGLGTAVAFCQARLSERPGSRFFA